MIILSHMLQKFDYKIIDDKGNAEITPRIMEEFLCHICGKQHEVLYGITRKVGQQFGHFMAFSIAGEWQVVDPTLPHDVMRLPRDAVRVPDDIASYSWHGEGHYFYLKDENGKALTLKELKERIEKNGPIHQGS